MKYFIDTEFLEGTQKTLLGNTKPTIDLISIAVVGEDGREYYAVSKEFNLKEAWNRYQVEKDETVGARIKALPPYKKIYWLRENVLLPIFFELAQKDFHNTHFKDEWNYEQKSVDLQVFKKVWGTDFGWFKKLIVKYGKSNLTIAEEIEYFVRYSFPDNYGKKLETDIKFYGYYCDYDWVVFCWLFGKMMNLPKGFPMYCRDLKQMYDEIQEAAPNVQRIAWHEIESRGLKTEDAFKIKLMKTYPKQENEHNALADAKWNKELYFFLNRC